LSDQLQLNASDRSVWRLTLEACQAPRPELLLAVRCSRGCLLAQCGTTAVGPLFISEWEVETDLPFKFRHDTLGDLSRRDAMRFRDATWPVEERSGAPITHTERHGTIALLALPPDLPQQFPDLLVRCKHGDAVLDRAEVLMWIRAGRVLRKVPTAMPRQAYARPRWEGSTNSTSTEVRRFSGGSRPFPQNGLDT
jgi:hypothetical protein